MVVANYEFMLSVVRKRKCNFGREVVQQVRAIRIAPITASVPLYVGYVLNKREACRNRDCGEHDVVPEEAIVTQK
jgi:hypothetical protein